MEHYSYIYTYSIYLVIVYSSYVYAEPPPAVALRCRRSPVGGDTEQPPCNKQQQAALCSVAHWSDRGVRPPSCSGALIRQRLPGRREKLWSGFGSASGDSSGTMAEAGDVLHSKTRLRDGSVPSSESSRNGYVKSCVTPLTQDHQRGFLFNVCRFCNEDILNSRLFKISALYAGAFAFILVAFLISRGLQSDPLWDLRTFLSGFSQSVSPLFSIGCAFFFLTFYLRRKKKESSGCWLLSLPASCFLGDFLVLRFLQWGEDQHQMQMVGRLLFVLGCVGLLTLIPTLKLKHSVLILFFASVVWLVSSTSLTGLPPLLRPFFACFAGMCGSLLGLGFDRYYPSREVPSRVSSAEEKVPVIRPRRRSSCVSLGETSTSYYGSCKMPRRPSLPCISREQVGPLQVLRGAHLHLCMQKINL